MYVRTYARMCARAHVHTHARTHTTLGGIIQEGLYRYGTVIFSVPILSQKYDESIVFNVIGRFALYYAWLTATAIIVHSGQRFSLRRHRKWLQMASASASIFGGSHHHNTASSASCRSI